MNSKVKNMVGIGLFTAIVVVLQLLGGGIKFGVFSISLVLVPIVVGAAVYSWKAGAWLGFAFGVTVLLSGDANAFMIVDPLATVLVVLVKGTLCGLIAGIVYKLLAKCNKVVAVIASGIMCPVVNTGVFRESSRTVTVLCPYDGNAPRITAVQASDHITDTSVSLCTADGTWVTVHE